MMAITSSRVIGSESGGTSPGGIVVVVVVVVGAVVVVEVVVVGGSVVVVVVVVVGGSVVVGGRLVVVVVVTGTAGRAATGAAASTVGTDPSLLPTTHIAPPARNTVRSRSSPRSWEVATGKRYCRSYHCEMPKPHLVLASSSPRRRGILTTLGLSFTISSPDVDESRLPDEPPPAFVERVAREKTLAAHRRGNATLGADTVVVLDDAVLVKPVSVTDAVEMLRRLSGRSHDVHSGVAVTTDGGTWSSTATTSVHMVTLDDELIDWYVSTGEPLDKAGSYALQGLGGAFVERIDGDPFNVIGLPLAATRRLFAAAGLDLLAYRHP